MVTGIITFGFGIGSFLFGILSTLLINPDNLKMEKIGSEHVYGPEVANKTMMALRKLSVCWILLTVMALFLIKIENKEENNIDDKEGNCEIEELELTLFELIKDRRYWLLYAMNFCSFFYGFTLIGSYKVFGGMYIHDDLFLTYVGSIGCVFGSIRFIWSIMLDYGFTYPQVYGTLCLTQLLCSSLIF